MAHFIFLYLSLFPTEKQQEIMIPFPFSERDKVLDELEVSMKISVAGKKM